MRLLMVGMEWFPNRAGGLGRYFYEEAHVLPAYGIEGTAIVTAHHQDQQAPLRLRAMGPEGASLSARWRGVRCVVREELRRDIEVVDAHFALYTYPWLRDLPASVPLVCHFQGPWALEMAAEGSGWKNRIRVALAQRIERAVYQRASRVITLSQAFADIAHTQYGVARERLRVVPGGIDTSLYTQAPERRLARERLNWPHDRPILLSVRRLARRMGLEHLLAAIAIARRHRPDVLLLIGGKGALAEELEAQIVRQGLQDNARLLGFISDKDLPLTYAAADLTIVPTIALEGFGLTTVESLASGTPVLGTAIGGTPEILRGLQPALIFAEPSPEAMAERILDAIEGRIPMPDRDACRAYVKRYDWQQVAPRLCEIFTEARNEALKQNLK